MVRHCHNVAASLLVCRIFYKKYGFHKVGDVPDSEVPLDYMVKNIGYGEN